MPSEHNITSGCTITIVPANGETTRKMTVISVDGANIGFNIPTFEGVLEASKLTIYQKREGGRIERWNSTKDDVVVDDPQGNRVFPALAQAIPSPAPAATAPPRATATSTPTPTLTPVPPTPTPTPTATPTVAPPTPTATAVPPRATPAPPRATPTEAPGRPRVQATQEPTPQPAREEADERDSEPIEVREDPEEGRRQEERRTRRSPFAMPAARTSEARTKGEVVVTAAAPVEQSALAKEAVYYTEYLGKLDINRENAKLSYGPKGRVKNFLVDDLSGEQRKWLAENREKAATQLGEIIGRQGWGAGRVGFAKFKKWIEGEMEKERLRITS